MTSKEALKDISYLLLNEFDGLKHKELWRLYLDQIKKDLEHKEKLEKAWEICKSKTICLLGVSAFKNVRDYNDLCNHIFENKSRIKYDQLTETEFNLLKEMLEER